MTLLKSWLYALKKITVVGRGTSLTVMRISLKDTGLFIVTLNFSVTMSSIAERLTASITSRLFISGGWDAERETIGSFMVDLRPNCVFSRFLLFLCWGDRLIVNKRLDHEDILPYRQWLESNPLIPAGLTSIDAYIIYKKGKGFYQTTMEDFQ